MPDLKKHFNEAAEDYDEQISKTLIDYDDMLEALINSIPDQSSPHILDLGCGTGNITKKLLERFSDANVTCLDISEAMIEKSKEKLADYENIEYVVGDFTLIDIIDKYDAIISSLALHHIPTIDEKKQMYQHIYDALNTNGVFYNADVIKANSTYNDKLNNRMSLKYMEKNNVSKEIIDDHNKNRETNDIPITMVEHLRLLDEVGFEEIDVIWKHYANAVYGGTRK